MAQQERTSYSRSEVAAALGCSVATIDRFIKTGVLRSFRVGRRVLIPQEAVNAFFEESPNSDASHQECSP